MPLFGWDASDYDWSRGSMDVAAAARDGIQFFTHKSSEATGVVHVHFGEAMRRARDAGIPFLGAYHVVRSPANAAAEVDFCLKTVTAATPWWKTFPGWFWQIDLEKWPYDAVAATEGESFADLIEARTGRRAIIYASKGQYGDALAGTSHPLWNANYPSSRAAPYRDLYPGDKGAGWTSYSGVTPAIWQYSSNATIGSQSTCDANAYRGSAADFASMIGGDMPLSKAEIDEIVYRTATIVLAGIQPAGYAAQTAPEPYRGQLEQATAYTGKALAEALANLTTPKVDAAALAKAILADPAFVLGLTGQEIEQALLAALSKVRQQTTFTPA